MSRKIKTAGINTARAKEEFKTFVVDQLIPFGTVECRAMFGGYGIYQGGVFFGILHKNRLYFKTNPDDAKTTEPYRERGMKPFQPNKKQTLKSYYEVPADVLEDPEALGTWAALAVRCVKSQ